MRPLILSLLLLTQIGCACTAAPAGPAIKVFKSRGSVQCGVDGLPPELMQKELQQAGITVQRMACGSDGRMRIAMCNAPDGRLNIFEIPATSQAAAEALGYAVLPPDARELACQPEAVKGRKVF